MTGCAANLNAFRCHAGGAPSEPYETGCTLVPDSGDSLPGDALYCCTFVPHCENLGGCGDAGVNIECNDPLTPQANDPLLICATLFSLQGASSYCCAYQTGCFPADLFGCGDAGQSYACAGDAAPSQYGLTCVAGAYEDAGTRGTYCCVSDAGLD